MPRSFDHFARATPMPKALLSPATYTWSRSPGSHGRKVCGGSVVEVVDDVEDVEVGATSSGDAAVRATASSSCRAGGWATATAAATTATAAAANDTRATDGVRRRPERI